MPATAAPVRLGRAALVSAATFASRLLGLARDQLFAALVGANAFSDAFVAAFRIPNLLRDLFAEGALSSAFVPTFADYQHRRGPAEAYRLAGLVFGLLLAIVGTLVLLGELGAGGLVALVAPGFSETRALTVLLTRIMMPFLLLVSLSAAAMGILNAQSRFAAPALAPAMFNVGSIAVGLLLWAAGLGPRGAVVGWSVGTLLGGSLQLAVQWPALRRSGCPLHPSLARAFSEPGVRRIGRLMGAAVVGLAATQVNIVVNTHFASREPGAVSWLNYAFRLMQFPLGVFGVAIATVAEAGVAQKAAEHDRAALEETLGRALRLVAFLNVPSAVGLIVLAEPIVALLYQHGRFAAADTAATAGALRCYALGLYGYSSVKVLAPAFYALDRARVPLLASFLGMAVNVSLNLALYPALGFRGVALGTSLAATVNFAVLAAAYRWQGGRLGGGLLRQGARVLLASLAMAIVALGALLALRPLLAGRGLPGALGLALGPVLVAALAYFALAHLLGLEEVPRLLGALGHLRPAGGRTA